MQSPRLETRFEDLPLTLPVFPLTGVLLLPRAKLPLNILSRATINMVIDAMRADRLIGMIQPHHDADGGAAPAFYDVGCAGRITSYSETEDGRILITLSGVCRFRVAAELETIRGYRMVRPRWQEFDGDFSDSLVEIDRDVLTAALALSQR